MNPEEITPKELLARYASGERDFSGLRIYSWRKNLFQGADLSGATLTQANLLDANLTNAKLVNTEMTAAIIGVANLSGADLTGANLRGVNRSRAILCHTIMPDGDEENRDCQ